MNPEFKKYQLSSLSALPFWFTPFYLSYIKRSFVLDNLSGKSVAKLTSTTFMKSFGLTAIYQPLFPYVGLASCMIKQQLFGDSKKASHAAISVGIVSASTALIVNPFEVKMVSIRSGLSCSKLSDYYRGSLFLGLRNILIGVNLFTVYPELKTVIDKKYPNLMGSGVLASILPATVTTFLVMPIDVVSSVLQKEIDRPKKEVLKELHSAIKKNGIRCLFVGSGWRVLATTIEVCLFNEFLKLYSD